MRSTKHFDLLCQMLGNTEPGIHISYLQSFSSFDWGELLKVAEDSLVSPLLYKHLQSFRHVVDFPESIQTRLKRIQLITAASNALLLHEAAQIFEGLKAQGIPAIGLKGAFLVENIYANIGQRRMSDLDIMVRRQDLAESIQLAEGLGYKPSTYFDVNDPNLDVKHVPPMIKANSIYLEIHYALLEEARPFSIDIPGLWERAVPAKIGGVDCLALSIEDLIMHLCIHMTYQHRFNMGLRGLVDILEVLRHYEGQVDWDVLNQRAEAWGAGKVVAISLSLLHKLLGVWVPAWAESDLQTDPEHTHMMEVGLGILRDPHPGALPVTPDLADFGLAKAIWKKTNLILKRIFIPKMTMARLYNISPKSWKLPFYYLLRFLELLKTYSGVGWRLLRRESLALEIARQESEAVRFTEWLTSR